MNTMFRHAGRTAMLGACLTAAALVGCANQDTDTRMDDRPPITRTGDGDPMTNRGDQRQPLGPRSQSSVAFPTGEREGSVLLVTKAVPRQVPAGQPFEYTITAQNITDDMVLENVVVIDEVTGGEAMIRTSRDGMTGEGGMTGESGMIRGGRDAGDGDPMAGRAPDDVLAGRDVDMANDGDEGEPANGPGTEAAIETDPNSDPDGVPRGARVGPDEDDRRGNMAGDRGDRMGNRDTTRMMRVPVLEPGQAQAGGRIDFGTLRPRESVTKTVQGSASQAGRMQVCTRVEYQPQVCSVIDVINPEIQLVQTLGSDRVLACQEIPLNYRLSNSGTGTARGVTLMVELPEGLRTVDGRQTIEGGRAYDIAQGQSLGSEQRPVMLRAEGPGEYTIRGRAMYAGQTVESNELTLTVVKPDLEITLEAPEDTIYASSRFDTTATIRNTGDGVARDLVVRQTLPAGLRAEQVGSNGQSQGNAIVWSLPPLEPGASTQVQATLLGTQPADVTTQVVANAFCADAATAQSTIDLEGIPALLLEVRDERHDPVRVGGDGQYQIAVTNQGSKVDTNVQIVATLPAGMEYASSTASAGGEPAVDGQALTYSLGDIQPGAEATIILNTRVTEATGDARFRVQMTSDELKDEPVNEEESTRLY